MIHRKQYNFDKLYFTFTTIHNGRLCNQIFRNLAVSIIAEKHDLFVNYSLFNVIRSLGINLFIGKYIHNNIIELNEMNYFKILNQYLLTSNLYPNNNFFQSKDISIFLHDYLHKNAVKTNIINKNPFANRYNANNDVIVHIRLDDVSKYNPGIAYYLHVLSIIQFDDLYITTDEINHLIIRQILQKYKNAKILYRCNETQIIQFASTCKNVILSHGSFSAIIGYLSFFSNIYYPEYEPSKMWYGDMFSIDGWNKISNNYLITVPV